MSAAARKTDHVPQAGSFHNHRAGIRSRRNSLPQRLVPCRLYDTYAGPMARLDSVNLGHPRPNPHKDTGWTGLGKQPTLGPVEVRAPGPRMSGLGSGLVGDFIGD